MMASAVYLIASLFRIILNLSRNYIIAIFGTGALALFLAFKLNEIIAKVSWLKETVVVVILIIFAVLCIAKDFSILKPKQTISPYSPSDFADTSIAVGFPPKSAAVRIAQYESCSVLPKKTLH